MAGKRPSGLFFVGVGHDGTPSAAFRVRARTIKGKPPPAPVAAPPPPPPRRRIICSAKDIPSSMEALAATWKKST